jgi:hypothetical protein
LTSTGDRRRLAVDGWATEVARRYGAEKRAEIEWAAWNGQVTPSSKAVVSA